MQESAARSPTMSVRYVLVSVLTFVTGALLGTTLKGNAIMGPPVREPQVGKPQEGRGDVAVAGRPGRFIVLTTARSGSTWVASLLHHQPHIAMGTRKPDGKPAYEPMQGSSKEWDKFITTFENTFKTAEAAYNGDGQPRAVGFKMMYDQVPREAEEQFVQYLEDNDIAVVQLTREAIPLRVSSLKEAYGAIKEKGWHAWHENDAEAAAKRRETAAVMDMKMADFLPKFKSVDSERNRWDGILDRADILHMRVKYEALTGPYQLEHLRSILAFLPARVGIRVDLDAVVAKSEMNMLAPPSCRDRLSPAFYEEIAKIPECARSINTCRLLDRRADKAKARSQ